MNITNLQFPGGAVKVAPNKARLEESAREWLSLAQQQLASVTYWAEAGDRTGETLKALEVLKAQLLHVEHALQESALVK